MFDAHTLGFFVAASLALLVTPGPAVLYIVGNSVEQGPRAGMVSALGLLTGGAVHMLAAVLGVTALLAASGSALVALRWVGAAYLIWLAWKEVSAPPWVPRVGDGPMRAAGRIWRRGLMVNLLNPKAALLFLAFLPRFVDPGRGDPRLQVLELGVLFLGVALCTDTAYALLGGHAGRLLRTPVAHDVRRWATAAIYAGPGRPRAPRGTHRLRGAPPRRWTKGPARATVSPSRGGRSGRPGITEHGRPRTPGSRGHDRR